MRENGSDGVSRQERGTNVEQEARKPGACLDAKDSLKVSTYGQRASRRLMTFSPLAITTYGIPSKATMALLRRCAQHTSDREGFLRHMTAALQIAVHRGNAQMLNAAVEGWHRSGFR